MFLDVSMSVLNDRYQVMIGWNGIIYVARLMFLF